MKLQNIINKFTKKRNNFYGNNEVLMVLIYFSLLFIVDYSGIMELYGQNFVRRLINMARRRDNLSYKNKLKPYCEPEKRMLNDEDIKKLQSIKIPDNDDIPFFSRKNTTTHQCCDKYSENEKQIITDISEKVRVKYEKIIGKKLYHLINNKATIYVYHGKYSQHLWHVDPQNLSEIYNIIICIKKKGNISPLQCKDIDGNEKSIYFNEGDAALFNGGTTVHQVPPNDDDDSERTVLSIAYTSNDNLNQNKRYGDNMCTYLEGGNNYVNVIKVIVSIFVLNFIVSFISGANNISYTFLSVFLAVVLLVVKYIPLYFDIGLGSGRSSSVLNNLFILVCTMIATVSTKGAILFFAYFALSDVFFSRSWVEYD